MQDNVTELSPLCLRKGEAYRAYWNRISRLGEAIIGCEFTDERSIENLATILMNLPPDPDAIEGYRLFQRAQGFLGRQTESVRALFYEHAIKRYPYSKDRIALLLSFPSGREMV